MNSRSGRLFLLFFGILLTLKLHGTIKGQDTLHKDVMAFFNAALQAVVVLKGDLVHPGVYAVSDVSSFVCVIKLAEPLKSRQSVIFCSIFPESFSDMKMDLSAICDEHVEIAEENITARQRVLLGLPLRPDQLTEEDWAILPGVGPIMAKRIIIDRQKNGDIGQISRLRRVNGVGDATLVRILPYFKN